MTHHDHSHNLTSYDTNKRALLFAFLITTSMIAVEVVGGIVSGSLALLSDAGHMFTDSGALALALFALWFSRRPATAEKTYGFYRLEILSALLNGSFLVLIAGYIFYQAIQRIITPTPVEGGLMLVVAGIGLVANLASAFILSRGGKENLNIQGALWHVISDALSSVGVIIGAIIIYFTGFYLVDPIIGFVIAIVILRGAWKLVSEAVDILLEATPKDIKLEKVIEAIKKQISGVRDVHDIHIWTISSGLRALSAHVLVDDILVSDCSNVSKRIKEILRQDFHIEHATIEFECEQCEGTIFCPRKK
ncbi:MAG: cation transporter [Candidatus Saganbacteria bacterium]|nr:cation transporter [Candidatus Saganbacteria bacterium]